MHVVGNQMKKKHANVSEVRKKAREPTAVANATPASSVFPRWPQKIMLTKPIRKVINWAMYWYKTQKCNVVVSSSLRHKENPTETLAVQSVTSTVAWVTADECFGFKRPWSFKKEVALLSRGSWCAALFNRCFLFLNASAPSLVLRKSYLSDCRLFFFVF